MKKNTRLFLFVDPYQPLGTFGGKVALEIRKWSEQGWRVQILMPRHLRPGNKRFPKEGYLLVRGIGFVDGDDIPQKVTREFAHALCSATRR